MSKLSQSDCSFVESKTSILIVHGIVAICCFVLMVVSGCAFGTAAKSPGGMSGSLVITGSSTCAPFIAEVARAFESKYPGTRIDVQTGGSSRGIRDALNGTADFGMSSRTLYPDEASQLESSVLAWDGVAFIVHQSNPVQELTREQLAKIYTGRADDWGLVGGAAGPLVVSSRAEGRSELELMTKFLGISATDIVSGVIDGETQQSIKTISTNKNAIGYTSLGAAQIAIANGEPIRLLPLDGIKASTESVQSGAFPVSRPLLLIRRKDDPNFNPLAGAFLSFAQSIDVDQSAIELGFVPPQRAPAVMVSTTEKTDP